MTSPSRPKAKTVPASRQFISFVIVAAFVLQQLLIISPSVGAAPLSSTGIVISQVYGGGGSSSGTPAYTNDYVELFNTGNSDVNIGGWSLQYGSSTGQFGSSSGNIFSIPTGTAIPAGRYLLVKLGTAGTSGASFTADFTSTGLSMAAASGKVALANVAVALGCGATATPCSLPDSRIVDSVAWGASNNGEGGTTVNNGTALDSTKGAIRKSDGCQDNDNNFNDFVVATTATGLVPRSLAGGIAHSCGVTNQPPTITAPANPITTVNQDTAPFTVNVGGSDDGGTYLWSATAGLGVSSVNVTGGQGTGSVTYGISLVAGFVGTATFTASLSDTVNPPVTRTVNINVNSNDTDTPPSIGTISNPIMTVAQDAAPFQVSISGIDDNGTYDWSASVGTGILGVSLVGEQGTPNATYIVTLQPGFNGTGIFTASLSDGVNDPVFRVVNITVTAPPPPLDHIVISQVYGGGGNSGATYRNDFVELYNPTTSDFDLGGWTVQYGSATGSTWQAQPLGGIIHPGEYYLVSLASGGAVGAELPPANVLGIINMSGTTGKVALVNNGDPLEGCVVSDPGIVDLVGFGGANCREGATNAPAPSNTLSILRRNGGSTDTNVNSADFVTGTPNPRRTAPVVEIGPYVLSSDPRANATTAPRDASINVTFTEPVNVDPDWFNISCAVTGVHNDATVASSNVDTTWTITPNTNFQPGEQCTVTVFKNSIHDEDLDDSEPDTDTLKADKSLTFTVSTGAAPAYGPEVHLTMGNPTDAAADINDPNNYLMEKPEFTLSYNRDRGTPNWVSWHLSDEWIGSLARVDTFRPDPAVPSDWYRVMHTDYFGSGFDRGHMVPNADRDPQTSMPINQATFLMTNMIPQAPDNNQGPWANMENYLRTLLPANELYIVAGGAGTGGTGSNGYKETFADGKVAVPAQTWKVALVIPKAAGDDISRVTASARTIAVIMPNTQGIRNVDWQNYLTSVDQVEALTGYDFYENLPDAIENSVEAGVNGNNPPGTNGQTVNVAEDSSVSIALEAAGTGSLSYEIVSQPANGTLSGTGANRTYTPSTNFNGIDSFTFRVSDGQQISNTSTVAINVVAANDAPAFASITPSSQSVDYSDPIHSVSVTVNDVDDHSSSLIVAANGLPNGLSLAETGVGQWTIAGNADAPAGMYQTQLTVTDPAGSFITSTMTINVGKEKAATAYTGDQNIMTSSPSITTAAIKLGAHLTQENDNFPGDITKATVTFELFKSGNVDGTPDLTVSGVAVDANGDASATLKAVAADIYNINVKVDSSNGFWVHSNNDIGVLTITVPTNDRRSSGGGWVPDPTSSSGKGNFGFTVKPGNNNNSAPKGNSTFAFRGADGFYYLVKGNSWQNGYLQFSAEPGTTIFWRSNFKGRCNVQKIDPASGLVVETLSNYTFEVSTRDGDLLTPRLEDAYSITVWDRDGGVWHRVGTAAAPVTLGGGNITNKSN